MTTLEQLNRLIGTPHPSWIDRTAAWWLGSPDTAGAKLQFQKLLDSFDAEITELCQELHTDPDRVIVRERPNVGPEVVGFHLTDGVSEDTFRAATKALRLDAAQGFWVPHNRSNAGKDLTRRLLALNDKYADASLARCADPSLPSRVRISDDGRRGFTSPTVVQMNGAGRPVLLVSFDPDKADFTPDPDLWTRQPMSSLHALVEQGVTEAVVSDV